MPRPLHHLAPLPLLLSAALLTPLPAAANDAITVRDFAVSETTAIGQRAGSRADLHFDDDDYEGLTEAVTAAGTSALEHTWAFDLSLAAYRSTVVLQAHHGVNIEGDDFALAYSTDDGGSWTHLATITGLADNNSTTTALLPDGLRGRVLLRATDTDRSAGNTAQDTLYVDQLYIESSGVSEGKVKRTPTEPLATLRYQTADMLLPLDINGFQPQQEGTFPLAIWVTGTNLNPWNGDDEIITREMAGRGYVAVSVDYSSRSPYPGSCERLYQSVAQIFDPSAPGSAINQITGLDKVDLRKGFVVLGFSQGGNIAAVAKNFHSDVRAAHVIGHGYNDNWGRHCLKDEHTVLQSSRIRSVMGLNDTAWTDWSDDDNRTMLEQTTGYSCGPEALQCPQANGSGWWLVTAPELAEGSDDHCFYYGPGVCGSVPMDANWEFGRYWWSMPESFDWLASWGDVKVKKDGSVRGAKPLGTAKYCQDD